MLKIGLSSCGKIHNEELFASYAKSGIGNMELSMKLEGYSTLDFEQMHTLAKKYGVNLWSFHLPFEFDIDISNPEYSKRTVEIHNELIKKASAIGIKIFVLHPSAEPIQDSERALRMSESKKSLVTLADIAAQYGATIAVENLPRTCLGKNADEMLELLNADERLRVCYDTNHLLSGSSKEFIKKLGKKIITTHVSDYDFINERHWLPGEGRLDWQEILATLKEVEYDGVWLYELGFDAPCTIERARELTCDDFVKNALEIFQGAPLTVLGTPKI